MKVNYDLKMEEILKEISESGKKKRLLIHSCCGPCSSSVLEYLKDYFKIDIYYYNPNITFDYEYWARMAEQKEMLEKLDYDMNVIEGVYNPKEDFFEKIKGLENEKEGGQRCYSCYDIRIGETAKNISKLFDEINSLPSPEKVIILFDEIDSIALDRTNSKDIREMGRATTAVLKGLDNLNQKILLIATTNLFSHFDKALVRRFDSVIDFNRYSGEDLIDISEIILNYYLSKFKFAGKNIRLFRKIISLIKEIPYPGDLKNIIKTSIAFSSPSDEYDYLKRLYSSLVGNKDLKTMQLQGFTVREIEILTGISKSQVSRELKE